MQDQILDMLLKKDEITWQDILHDLIKSERMDPWDIDISLLSKKYMETVRNIQETNFFISGKVVLASAILLKIKSNKLLNENIVSFDDKLYGQDELEEEIEQLESEEFEQTNQPKLTIKTPITRKRKVSLQDLVQALGKALEVDNRRKIRRQRYEEIPDNLQIPERKIDLSRKIKEVYSKVISFFKTKKGDLTFRDLTPSNSREDIVYTFIPLLHLENQKKVLMQQPIPFENIQIFLKDK
jgi:segregation and condensation protein A